MYLGPVPAINLIKNSIFFSFDSSRTPAQSKNLFKSNFQLSFLNFEL